MRESRPEPPVIRPYMPELDSVRGIAILMVLFFHGMAAPGSSALSGWGQMLFKATRVGWAGVDLFFVLSGFLITGILVDTKSRSDYLRRFYLRRALRILPALYATLAALWLTGLISWPFLALTTVFLANSTNLFGVSLLYGPLWSLAVEEHFYLLWPSLVRKLKIRTLAAILVLIWLVTPGLRLAWTYSGHSPQGLAMLNTWFNLDGLAMGSLLAIWVRHSSFSRQWAWRLSLPAMAIGALSFWLLMEKSGSGEVLLPCCCTLTATGLLTVILLVGTSQWSFLVDRPLLKFFGFISYGLYLIHVLAFHTAEKLLAPVWRGVISGAGPTSAMLLRFALGSGLGITLAYCSRRSLEEAFLRRRFKPNTTQAMAETVLSG